MALIALRRQTGGAVDPACPYTDDDFLFFISGYTLSNQPTETRVRRAKQQGTAWKPLQNTPTPPKKSARNQNRGAILLKPRKHIILQNRTKTAKNKPFSRLAASRPEKRKFRNRDPVNNGFHMCTGQRGVSPGCVTGVHLSRGRVAGMRRRGASVTGACHRGVTGVHLSRGLSPSLCSAPFRLFCFLTTAPNCPTAGIHKHAKPRGYGLLMV